MIERLGPLLLIVGLAAAIASAFGGNRPAMVAVAFAAGVLSLIPIGGLSATDLVFSVVGPLSGASFVLMVIGIATLLWPEHGVDGATGAVVLAALIAAIAVPLYATTLGGGAVDVYRFGFSGLALPAVVLVLLAAGLWFGSAAVAIWVIAAGSLYLLGAYPSRNLFDYLVDPVAVVLAGVVLAQAVLGRLMQ